VVFPAPSGPTNIDGSRAPCTPSLPQLAGVGSGGTLTGAGRYLRERNPRILLAAVEPSTSAVLSGGAMGPHGIQGLGAGFVPANLDRTLIDEVVRIDTQAAIAAAQELALKEGLLAGISAGANVLAARQLAQKPEHKGKTIVTIICDTGERYLSTALFQRNP